MEKRKRYYHFTLSSSLLCSLVIAIGSFICGRIGLLDFGQPSIIEMTFFTISVLLIFLAPIIYNRHLIKNAYNDDLLDDAITLSIEGAKQNVEKNKYSFFLREIVQANKINPLNLDINGKEFDDLYVEAKATLSITEIPLYAWKNPEYSWFLLNHYAVTLLKRLEEAECTHTGGTPCAIRITDRHEDPYKRHMEMGFDFLKELSESKGFAIKGFVRFLMVTKDEIHQNYAICEQLVASHDLFGVHLFLVDKEKIYANPYLYNCYNHLRGIGNNSNSILDMMIYQTTKNTFEYKIGGNGLLKGSGISGPSRIQIQRFIKDLAKQLTTNTDWLIYPSKNEPFDYQIDGVNTNKEKTFLDVS